MENLRCEKAVEKKHNVQVLALWPVHAEQSPVLQL